MPASLLGAVGLAFTLASFWWLWLRRGRLVVTTPAIYAMVAGSGMYLRFPAVFYNTGAVPIVVEDLRLIIDDHAVLDWLSVRQTVRPGRGDVVDNAGPFAVAGRSTERMVIEFQELPPKFFPEPMTKYVVQLQAKVRRSEWRDLHSFDWWSPLTTEMMTAYIAHRNAPAGGPVA